MSEETHGSERMDLRFSFEPDAEFVEVEVRERPMEQDDRTDWQ